MKELKELEEQGKRIRRAIDKELDEREKALEDEKLKLEAEQERMNAEMSEADRSNQVKEEILKRKEIELSTKNAILEIRLKMNETGEKLAIQLTNTKGSLKCMEATEINKQLEEREKNLQQQEEKLDERELQLEEKNMIMDIAFRIKEFR